MGEVVQFDRYGKAPRRMMWICPLCGRYSPYRWSERAAIGWTDDCAEVAIVVEIEKVLFDFSQSKVISLKGEDGWKYGRIQEITRQIALRDGRRLFHP